MESESPESDGPDPAGPAPPARTIALAALTPAQLRDLVAELGPRGTAILASHDRFVARERLLLSIVPLGLFGVAALAASDFGAPCFPRAEASWALAYALALAPLALVIARAIGWVVRSRGMPFPPGVYVLDRHVVIAHGPALRIVPLGRVAGIGAPRRALGGLAEITLWIEGEGAETCAVPAAQAESIGERIEQAREAALADVAPRDVFRRRRADALSELERSSAWDRASAAPPRSDLPLSVAVAIPLALALGIGALVARNTASDTLAVASSASRRDVEGLACYVAAGGAESDRVRREVLPRTAYAVALAAGDAASLGRYVEAYPDGPDSDVARERWIAMEYEAARGSAWSLRAFVTRFPDAPQTEDARAALPRLALEEAIRADEVDAYTYVISEYGGTPEADAARARRHARYERTLETLLARGGRAETAAFLRQLFAWLEAHDGPEVLVRFRTPDDDAVRRVDAAVQAVAGQPVVPLAPSFSRRLSVQREALVFDRLARAFGALAPRDVLPIARGAQLPTPLTEEELEQRLAGRTEEEASAERARLEAWVEDETDQPEIRIDYTILPTGGVYVSDAIPSLDRILGEQVDERAFTGFRVRFAIEMRIPEREERHAFVLDVEPPPAFTVDGGDGRASGGTIYEAMATQAFDRLGDGLAAAFLGEPEADIDSADGR